MSDNENLEEKSGTEELKQKPADHRPLIEKAAEAASDIEKASYKPFAGALDWAGSLVYAVLAMLLLNLFVFRSIMTGCFPPTSSIRPAGEISLCSRPTGSRTRQQ